MNVYRTLLMVTLSLMIISLTGCGRKNVFLQAPTEVDYVDVHQGTWTGQDERSSFPVVQLPNSLLRIIPYKETIRSARIKGLPLYTPQLDENPLFFFIPLAPDAKQVGRDGRGLSFDFQELTPYSYHIYLDELAMVVDYTLSSMCGLYTLTSSTANTSGAGRLDFFFRKDATRGVQWQRSGQDALTVRVPFAEGSLTQVYLYMQFDSPIVEISTTATEILPDYVQLGLALGDVTKQTVIRYGISLISAEQAEQNLRTQIQSYEHAPQLKAARNEWQKVLHRVQISGGSEVNMRKFYTALYRSYLYPVRISESGRYYSPIDDSVHDDEGIPQYYQDFLDYSYETSHPLMLLLNPDLEHDVLVSCLRATEQAGGRLLANLDLGRPSYTDHTNLLYILADAQMKGVLDQDIRGVFETIRVHVDSLAITRTPGYDLWCLSHLANALGYNSMARMYDERSLSYVPSPGRLTAQQVEQILESEERSSPAVLPEGLINIDSLLSSSQHSLDVDPDLFAFLFAYNLMGRPHDAQKFVRHVIDYYFNLGTFGYPGPDHYGSLSSALVFAMMGLYPVAPGINGYSIGAPVFNEINIDMGGGRHLRITADGASEVNKYISGLSLNGRPYPVYWVKHSRLSQGGSLSMFLSDSDH